jgi:hypothetical protein
MGSRTYFSAAFVVLCMGLWETCEAKHKETPPLPVETHWERLVWRGEVIEVSEAKGEFQFSPAPFDPYEWFGLTLLGVRLVLADRERRYVPHLRRGQRIDVEVALLPGGGGRFIVTTITGFE